MSEYRLNEGTLELPAGWDDRTITALSFPAGAKKPDASFAVTRDGSVPAGSSLSAYVDRQMVDMAKTCPKFELVYREQIQLNGTPAEQIRFRWRSPEGGMVEQQQTSLLLGNGSALTFTATSSPSQFGAHAKEFAALVGSFRPRDSLGKTS